MLSLLSLLAVGFALGLRHALDADHVLAVATIATRARGLRAAAAIGILWGVGHSLTVFVVGAAMLVLGLVIPERLGMAFEFGVGIMLAVLGISTLWATWRAAHRPVHGKSGGPSRNSDSAHDLVFGASPLHGVPGAGVALARSQLRYRSVGEGVEPHVHAHVHGDYVHSHRHGHGDGAHGHREDDTPQGRLDRWFGRLTLYQVARPVVVGVVHGLAGSAAVALLVLASVHDPLWGLAYLAVFGIGTTVGMMLVTLLIAAPMALGSARSAEMGQALRVGAGVLSLAFGLFLMYHIGVEQGLLSAGAVAAAR